MENHILTALFIWSMHFIEVQKRSPNISLTYWYYIFRGGDTKIIILYALLQIYYWSLFHCSTNTSTLYWSEQGHVIYLQLDKFSFVVTENIRTDVQIHICTYKWIANNQRYEFLWIIAGCFRNYKLDDGGEFWGSVWKTFT